MKNQLPNKTITRLTRQADEVSNLLKQLSHPQRLLILCSLADGEKTVGDIEHVCGASQSAVSQFLKGMRLENLIEARREGKHVYYMIKDRRLIGLMKSLYQIFCTQ